MKLSLLALICITSIVFNAGIVESQTKRVQCAAICTGSSKFGYEVGKTYQYTYEANTKTLLQGATEQHSSLHIKATVDIEVLSKCELQMKLKGVSLKDSHPSQYNKRDNVPNMNQFKQMLEENVLRFSYQDGHIENLCPADGEKVQALNIKRGILSAFQNTMEDFSTSSKTTEVDISGECPTEYTALGKSLLSRMLTVKKTKDILGCVRRHGYINSILGKHYKVPNTIQSLPLMKSWHSCEHTIGHKSFLQKVVCKESHVFRAFSNKVNGAATHVDQTLEFVKHFTGTTAANPVKYRSTLSYDHVFNTPQSSSSTDQTEATIRNLCDKIQENIRPEVPKLFAQLVYNIRHLSLTAIHKLHRKIQSGAFCDQAIKYFYDAIPMVGTADSVGFIKDLIMKGRNGFNLDSWIGSLAFISQPNKDMLQQAKFLLQLPNPDKKAYLSVSALVNAYCQTAPNCRSDKEVKDIIQILIKAIRNSCSYSNSKQKSTVLLGLRALGNAGHTTIAIPYLVGCFENKKLDIEVRLAAIDAFRRQPCDADRSALLSLYEGNAEVEMRIAAYLAVMQCPNPTILNRIQAVLEIEKVNQVGSFVWTHLTNLYESSCPMKTNIQPILENIELRKSFNLDKRKFSRNIEKSVFSKAINSGLVLESNLVWAKEEFSPRSAMLNLTVDMFGTSINLLEIGGRVEGLSTMLENIFKTNQPRYTTPSKGYKDAILASNIKKMDKIFKIDNPEDMSGSGYVRVFGNEIDYMEFVGEELKKKLIQLKLNLNLFRHVFKPFQTLYKEIQKPRKFDYTKSVMFLDSHMVIPTIAGLPLNLTIHGTSSVQLNFQSHFNIEKNQDFDAKLVLKPSGAVEISGMMTVDAFVAKAGLKTTSTIHTSTEFGATSTFSKKDASIKTSYQMPRDKLEIVDIQNKFFISHRDRDHEQNMITSNKINKKLCTGPRLKNVLGLQLCGEIQLPNALRRTASPFYPLTGPTTMKITLNKVDTFDEYVMSTQFIKPRYHIFPGVNFHFNTPGSKINRELLLDIQHSGKGKSISTIIDVKSPWKKVHIKLDHLYFSKMSTSKIIWTMIIDGKKKYIYTSDKLLKTNRNQFELKVKSKLQSPHTKLPITFISNTKFIPKLKIMNFDMELKNALKKPVILTAKIQKKTNILKSRYESYLDLKSQFLSGKLNIWLEKTPYVTTSHMEASYNYPKKKAEFIKLDYKVQDKSQRFIKHYKFDSSFRSSVYPDYNFQLSNTIQNGKEKKIYNSDFRYGADPNDPNHQVICNVEARVKRFPSLKQYTATLKLKYPLKKIHVQGDMMHKITATSFDSETNLSYKPGKKVSLTAHFKKQAVGKFKLQGQISLKSSIKNTVHVIVNVDETEPKTYTSNVILQWKKKSVSILSTYKMKDRNSYEFSNILRTPNWPAIINKGMIVLSKQMPTLMSSIEYKGNLYSARFNGTFTQLSRIYAMDVMHPKRRLKGEVTVSSLDSVHNGKLIFNWDADKNPQKMLSLTGHLVNKSKKKSLDSVLKFIDREISTDFTLTKEKPHVTSIRTSMKWDNDKKMLATASLTNTKRGNKPFVKGSFKLSGSFGKIVNFVLDGMHGWNGKKMKNQAKLKWKKNKRITIQHFMTYKSPWNFDTKLSVHSPFKNFKSSSINIRNSLMKLSTIKTTITGSSDVGRMEISLFGKINKAKKHLKWKSDLTFSKGQIKKQRCRVGLVSYSLNFDGTQKKFTLTDKLSLPNKIFQSKTVFTSDDVYTTINYNNKIDLCNGKKYEIILAHKKSTWTADPKIFFTQVNVKTPIKKYKSIEAKVIYNEQSWGPEPVTASAHFQLSSNKYEIMGKKVISRNNKGVKKTTHMLQASTPIKGYKSLKVNLTQTSDIDNIQWNINAHMAPKYAMIGSITWPRELTKMKTFTIQGNVQLDTPMKNYKQMGLDINLQRQGERMMTRLIKLTINKNQYTLDDKLNKNEYYMKLTIKRPKGPYKRMVVSIDVKVDAGFTANGKIVADGQEYTSLTMSKGAVTSILKISHGKPNNKVDFALDINGLKSISCALITKIILLKFNMNNRFQYGDYATNTFFTWGVKNEKNKMVGINALLRYETAKIIGELTVSSPKLEKPIKLISTLQRGNGLYSHVTTLDYDKDSRKKFTIFAKVGQMTPNNYTLQFGVTHLKSKVNIIFESHTGMNTRMITSAVNFNYMNAEGKNQFINIFAEVDKPKGKLLCQMQTPFLPFMTMYGKASTIRNTLNVKATFGIGFHKKKLDECHLTMLYTGSSLTAETYCQLKKKRRTEALVTMTLKNPYLIQNTINWRPRLFEDMKSTLKRIGGIASKKWTSWNKQHAKELSKKSRHISNSIRYDLVAPLKKYLKTEVNEVVADLDQALSDMPFISSSDIKLFMKKKKQWKANMKKKLVLVISKLTKSMQQLQEKIQEQMKKTTTKLRGTVQALSQKWKNIDLRKAISKTKLVQKMTAQMKSASKKYTEYKKLAMKKWMELKKKVKNIQSTISTRDLQMWYKTMNDAMPVPQYAMKLKDIVIGHITSIPKIVKSSYKDTVKQLDQRYRELTNHPIIKNMRVLTTQTYTTTKWAYKYYKVEETAKSVSKQLSTYADNFIKREMKAYLMTKLPLSDVAVTMYDLKKGKVQADFILPKQTTSLHTLIKIDANQYKQMIQRLLKQHFSKDSWTLIDYYYKYKPVGNIREWFPPYTAHATLMGDQHFKTFDNTHYDFAGKCTYVLARNFANKDNWAILLKYHNKNAILQILTQNNLLVEINMQDMTVMVENRKTTTLPYWYGNSAPVFRIGQIISVNVKDRDVMVSCDIKHKVCRFSISGWLHGKTAGLLGTYDNEPYNDFMTSTGTIARTVNDFAQSWKVGYCSSNKNSAIRKKVPTNSPLYTLCADLFETWGSPFRNCYKIVDPMPYTRKCLKEVNLSDRTSVCSVSSLYVSECLKAGVKIAMPSHCVKCDLPSGLQMKGGEISTIEYPPKSADVVFLIELGNCNKVFGKQFKNLVKHINLAFKQKGLTDNRFGIIGFSALGAKNPTMYTFDGKLFANYNTMTSREHTIPFTGGSSSYSDPLNVIEMATTYPYRPGVTKHLVLLRGLHPHHWTILLKELQNRNRQQRFKNVQRQLEYNDITLHLLTMHDFNNLHIFGVDSSRAYTYEDAKKGNFEGDTELYDKLKLPKDTYVALSQGSHGSVFNTQQLINFNSDRFRQKTFLKSFSERMAVRAEPSACYKCECVEDNVGTGRSVCGPCNQDNWNLAAWRRWF